MNVEDILSDCVLMMVLVCYLKALVYLTHLPELMTSHNFCSLVLAMACKYASPAGGAINYFHGYRKKIAAHQNHQSWYVTLMYCTYM